MNKKAKMSNSTDKTLKNILGYNVSRQYFGQYSAADINEGYAFMRRSYSTSCPQNSKSVYIGTVNGTTICRALWQEMSYNPVRFGTVSPFVFNDHENIYQFCKKNIRSTSESSHILHEIRGHLITYMTINSGTNGAWYDQIVTNDGYVVLRFIDGHSGPMYKMLGHLRDCIKIIAKQNVADSKSEPYRTKILETVNLRHPNGVRPLKYRMPEKTNMILQIKDDSEIQDDIEEARIDNMAEQALITLDNKKYFPPQQVIQAFQDLHHYQR